MSDARLVIWNPRSGVEEESIPLRIRPVVSDSDSVVIALDPDDGQPFIRESWVGMDFSIEVSPRAVTADPMTHAIADVAKRMGVRVG